MNSSQKARLHAYVEGYVQGVGFRFFTMQNAWKLHLNGWVRNRSNGEVEVVAEGEKKDLEDLIQLLRMGPPSAEVKNVRIDWEDYKGEFEEFQPTFSL